MASGVTHRGGGGGGGQSPLNPQLVAAEGFSETESVQLRPNTPETSNINVLLDVTAALGIY